MDRQVALRYPMGNDDIHEDYICWLQILKEYGSSVAINEPLLLYRQMRNSKSGSKLSSAKKTFAVYRKVGYGVIRSLLLLHVLCGKWCCKISVLIGINYMAEKRNDGWQ